jgi:transmembrane sensor
MARLLTGLIHEQLTPGEKAELETWIAAHPDNGALAHRLLDADYRNSILSTWDPGGAEASLQRVKHRIALSKRRTYKMLAAAAAVIFILCGAGIILYQAGHRTSHTAPVITYKNDVGPGTDKAILTLADGRKISLTDVPDGQLANPTGISIMKMANGEVVYHVSDVRPAMAKDHRPVYNTLQTPAGGQHRIQLPDGTRVWLNALSVLKFPQNFLGMKERTIELEGEAYFEVASNKEQPFIVRTDRQIIEVLGTHFDIKSYKTDPSAATTLLEGSVRSSDTRSSQSSVLKPGDQFLTDEKNGLVKQVDTLSVIDWKNGEFIFHNENIRDIMREVTRWYDVEVIFADNAAGHETFSGSVSRYDNVSELLKTLQLTGRVHFDIEGRKIIVNK